MNRAQFKQYCLRALGHPVLKINVSDDQIEDRIDDAIQFFQEYNADATVRGFWSYQCTSQDVENGFITVPDNFISVIGLIPFSSSVFAGTMMGTAGLSFAGHAQTWDNVFMPGGITYLQMAKDYLENFDRVVRAAPRITFSRSSSRIYFDTNDKIYLKDGQRLVFEVYHTIDPAEFSKIYDNWILKRHAIALIKKQWGENLSKFSGMSMPGNVQFNASEIISNARNELEAIERDYAKNFDEPIGIFIG